MFLQNKNNLKPKKMNDKENSFGWRLAPPLVGLVPTGAQSVTSRSHESASLGMGCFRCQLEMLGQLRPPHSSLEVTLKVAVPGWQLAPRNLSIIITLPGRIQVAGKFRQ